MLRYSNLILLMFARKLYSIFLWKKTLKELHYLYVTYYKKHIYKIISRNTFGSIWQNVFYSQNSPAQMIDWRSDWGSFFSNINITPPPHFCLSFRLFYSTPSNFLSAPQERNLVLFYIFPATRPFQGMYYFQPHTILQSCNSH